MNDLPKDMAHCCAPYGGPPAQGIFPKSVDTARDARKYVREVLSRDDDPLDPDRFDEVVLIASELVTNAYRYGTEPGDAILVSVLTTSTVVRVEVHDPCRTRPQLLPTSAERGRGRGLHIVNSLARDWGSYDRPLGKAVWAEVTR
ncbi:ATP-binding protein [Streptomyces sp. NPDC094032]|uniref:ATP-binding protein n=1 Tax=Streptomyces sp. NPDC094032 TaxID=3155308 RepID=UPI0033343427